jgi:hypothetical protein
MNLVRQQTRFGRLAQLTFARDHLAQVDQYGA